MLWVQAIAAVTVGVVGAGNSCSDRVLWVQAIAAVTVCCGCRQELLCGHRCQGTCGQCKMGRLHVPCQQPCRKVLVCGHDCKATCCQCPPCSTRCQNRSVPPAPPAVRTGQCCYTRCQNRSVLLHPLSEEVSTAVRTGQYHPDPPAVRTGQYRCQNRPVPLSEKVSIPLLHPLSEHVSTPHEPPAVRTGQ